MPHLISPKPSGLVIDTNVLSLLAASNKLSLLHELVIQPLCITPSIYNELLAGLENDVHELADVIQLVDSKMIWILALNTTEQAIQFDFPKKLAKGESDAIALCRERNMLFVTHDHKAANYCDRENIECIRFEELLSQFHEVGLLTLDEVNSILA